MSFQHSHAQAEASQASLELRRAKALVRGGLHSGTLRIADVVHDPPACLHGLNMHEVVAWTRGMSRTRMEILNRKALGSGVNLMVRIERASGKTREWVAANVSEYARTSNKRARLGHGDYVTPFRRAGGGFGD